MHSPLKPIEKKSAIDLWFETRFNSPEGKAVIERYQKYHERPKPSADDLAAAFFPLLCAVAEGGRS